MSEAVEAIRSKLNKEFSYIAAPYLSPRVEQHFQNFLATDTAAPRPKMADDIAGEYKLSTDDTTLYGSIVAPATGERYLWMVEADNDRTPPFLSFQSEASLRDEALTLAKKIAADTARSRELGRLYDRIEEIVPDLAKKVFRPAPQPMAEFFPSSGDEGIHMKDAFNTLTSDIQSTIDDRDKKLERANLLISYLEQAPVQAPAAPALR